MARDRAVSRRALLGSGAGAMLGGVSVRDAWAANVQPTALMPDGANATRLGLLVADFDFTPEPEVAAMSAGRVSVYAARMPVQFTRADLTSPTHADGAAAQLAPLDVGAVMYASTSTGYFLGPDGEDGFVRRMQERTRGAPFVSPAATLASALRGLGVKRVFLVHPPWFRDETHRSGQDYFRARGFELVAAARMTPPRRFSEVAAAEVFSWVVANTPKDAQAVVQGGNGMRMAGAIAALEQALGRPVVTANQAMLWCGLRAAKSPTAIRGYGRLFTA